MQKKQKKAVQFLVKNHTALYEMFMKPFKLIKSLILNFCFFEMSLIELIRHITGINSNGFFL